MFEEGSILQLVLEGGWVSLSILAILFGMSIASWGIIFFKWLVIHRMINESHKFLVHFKREKKMGDVLNLSHRFPDAYSAKQYDAAYREFSKFCTKYRKTEDEEQKSRTHEMVRRVERTMENNINYISRELEGGLPLLASISSAAPFIGLLGTVIGIINSFQSIGLQGATSLAVVAPGISEALVATAFGLFAAIPALLAYNYFRNKIRFIGNEMRTFGLDLLNKFEWVY